VVGALGSDPRRTPFSARTPSRAQLEVDRHGGESVVFRHACKMGLEGIVSKRKDSPYRSGRSPDWLKLMNPASVAAAREAEEDWYN
jgi:ATP-dependent DNA ligase